MKFNFRAVLFLAILFIISTRILAQQNYFIDAVSGNDANAGTSITTPWKNISKLNNLTIAAGSTINLKSGSVWNSQQLKFKGSGTATSFIIVNSYGSGSKPIINGNGLVGEGVVYLYNQQYIEINNLEITNAPNGPVNSDFFVGVYSTSGTNPNPKGADRRGVMVAIDGYGTANHIYLKNLNIHHIKGQLGSGNTSLNGAVPKRTGGIYFTVLGNIETSSNKSRFNDILIDSCDINYCENMGLAFDNEWNVYYPGGQNSSISADRTEYTNWFNRRFSNVLVRRNVIHHIGKNAMIIRCTDSTGLIERNVCYETALGTTGNTMFTARAKGTVFQYNEASFNRATTQNVDPGSIDGSMYDPDFGSVGIIFQYSYSHDNCQGIYWGCNTRGASNNTSGIPDPGDVGCTLRYCVSQNDLGDLVFFNYSSAGNEIYNNVFYIKSGIKPDIIHENGGNNHTYNFFNNIIYNLSSATTGASYAFGSGTGVQVRNFSNNIFYGSHPSGEPADPFKLTSNPNFVSPGTGGTGINSVDGYKLNVGSPAINSGKLISANGGKDYYGNAVSSSIAPNRGMYQGIGIGAIVPTITSFSPSTAVTGAVVVIKGTKFTGVNAVTLGGTTAAFTFVNDSTINVVVGNGATGKIVVTTPSGSATSASTFNFCVRPPSPVAPGVSICKGTSTILMATGVGSMSWYNAPTGGTLLGNGNDFGTPVLNTNTTYYVQDSTCAVSATRTAVVVNILFPTNNATTTTACNSYVWNGITYTASGNFTYNYTNTAGCPSVDTLHLTINKSTNNVITISQCNSYTWNGITYTNSGTYTNSYTNTAGCPSVDTLKLTIKKSSVSTTTVFICANQLPYTWNGENFPAAGTYVTHFINAAGCDSSATLILNVNPLPVVSISGLATTYNITAAPVTLTGLPVGGTFSGPGITGTTFTPTAAGVGGPYTITYSYTDDKGCSNTASAQTNVISCTIPNTPGTITTVGGTATICPGTTKTYSILAVSGATSYTWTPPTGGNITAGQGTTQVTISYTTAFTASGTLKVVASNACGISAARSLAITRNTPLTPGVITGSTYGVCNSSGVAYSVVNVAGRTYNWTFNTTTATVASGQGTSAIKANFLTGYLTGTLSVTASNACGTSAARTTTIRAIPATPAAITGPSTFCANQAGVPYSIAAIPSATSYYWVSPAGSKIFDGVTTSVSTSLTTTSTAVTINFGSTAGTVYARGNNACGFGAYKTLPVTITCRQNEAKGTNLTADIKSLNVLLSPNPSSQQFNLIVHSRNTQPVILRVINSVGIVVYHARGQAEQSFRFGENFSDGLYRIVVRQGEEEKTVKGLKGH